MIGGFITMVLNQPEFTVLLDQRERIISRSFSLTYSIRGAPFYRIGATGVADSIAAVQKANLLQTPTYFLGNGRKYADKDSEKPSTPVWVDWHDGLGERLTLQVEKGYNGVPNGLQVVDIQGAGIFMSRPEEIRAVVEGRDPSRKLKNYGYPVSEQEKDLVLGEKQAYRWNGTQLEVVPVRFFPSYEAFAEEAKTSEFKKALREMTVVYAVVRPAEQARKNPFGYQPIEVQLTNPNLAIPLGGEDQVRAIFLDNEEQPLFGWERFGTHHDGYKTVDSGRVASLLRLNDGVDCSSNLSSSFGRSVGVAPEALVVRVENGAFKNPSLDEVVEALRGTSGRMGVQ